VLQIIIILQARDCISLSVADRFSLQLLRMRCSFRVMATEKKAKVEPNRPPASNTGQQLRLQGLSTPLTVSVFSFLSARELALGVFAVCQRFCQAAENGRLYSELEIAGDDMTEPTVIALIERAGRHLQRLSIPAVKAGLSAATLRSLLANASPSRLGSLTAPGLSSSDWKDFVKSWAAQQSLLSCKDETKPVVPLRITTFVDRKSARVWSTAEAGPSAGYAVFRRPAYAAQHRPLYRRQALGASLQRDRITVDGFADGSCTICEVKELVVPCVSDAAQPLLEPYYACGGCARPCSECLFPSCAPLLAECKGQKHGGVCPRCVRKCGICSSSSCERCFSKCLSCDAHGCLACTQKGCACGKTACDVCAVLCSCGRVHCGSCNKTERCRGCNQRYGAQCRLICSCSTLLTGSRLCCTNKQCNLSAICGTCSSHFCGECSKTNGGRCPRCSLAARSASQK